MTAYEHEIEGMRAELCQYSQEELKRRVKMLAQSETGEDAEWLTAMWEKLLSRQIIDPDKLLSFKVEAIYSISPCSRMRGTQEQPAPAVGSEAR